MRISDWSSDVCSSDLALQTTARNGKLVGAIQLSDSHEVLLISDGGTLVRTRASEISQVGRNTQGVTLIRLAADESLQAIERVRSEEHTSELPSLMRLSYAVFCLKQKTKSNKQIT